MTSNHACKPGIRYRYYNTRPDLLGGAPAWRVSAHDLEQHACTRIAELLVDQHAICALLGSAAIDAQLMLRVINTGDVMAAQLRSGSYAARVAIFEAANLQVTLQNESIDIALDAQALLGALGHMAGKGTAARPIQLSCPATKVRRGHQLRLIIPAPDERVLAAIRDERLVALLAEANTAVQLLQANPGTSIAQIAKGAGRCRTRLTQLVMLSCLAPDIVTAIVEGRQPPSLTARSLLGTELPLAWSQQRAVLGFS